MCNACAFFWCTRFYVNHDGGEKHQQLDGCAKMCARTAAFHFADTYRHFSFSSLAPALLKFVAAVCAFFCTIKFVFPFYSFCLFSFTWFRIRLGPRIVFRQWRAEPRKEEKYTKNATEKKLRNMKTIETHIFFRRSIGSVQLRDRLIQTKCELKWASEMRIGTKDKEVQILDKSDVCVCVHCNDGETKAKTYTQIHCVIWYIEPEISECEQSTRKTIEIFDVRWKMAYNKRPNARAKQNRKALKILIKASAIAWSELGSALINPRRDGKITQMVGTLSTVHGLWLARDVCVWADLGPECDGNEMVRLSQANENDSMAFVCSRKWNNRIPFGK